MVTEPSQRSFRTYRIIGFICAKPKGAGIDPADGATTERTFVSG